MDRHSMGNPVADSCDVFAQYYRIGVFQMKCKYCKADDLPPHARFCPWCGKKQKQDAVEIKVPPPQRLPSGTYFNRVTVKGERVPISAATEEEYYTKARAAKLGLIEAKKPDNRIVKDLVEEYIKAREATLSPATIDGYDRKSRQNLQSLFPLRVKDLTKAAAQKAVNEDLKTYAPKTVWEAWSLVQSATGVRYDDLIFPDRKPRRKPHVYSEEQIAALLHGLADYGGQTECAGLLALWLSLRRSEIMGLKWADIQKDSVRIQSARVYDKKHKLVEKSTKNKSSERTILCPAYILDKLNALPKKGDYVFTMSTSGIWDGINTVCDRAGIPHGYLHGLRHTNASILELLNIPSVYANRRTGHANDHVRKTVYTDVMSEGARAAAEKVNAHFADLIAKNVSKNANES